MTAATEVGGVDQRGTGGIELSHEDIGRVRDVGAVRNARRRLEGPRCRWEVGRGCETRHVGVARGGGFNAATRGNSAVFKSTGARTA